MTPAPSPTGAPTPGPEGPRPALQTPTVKPDVKVGTAPGGLGILGGALPMGGPAEPNIAATPDGTLYVSGYQDVWRSDDNGTTWTKTAAQGIAGGGDGDIAVDANGTLYWFSLGGGVPFQVSQDRGETFSDPVDLSNGTGFDREWITSTPDGRLYTTWRGTGGLEFRASPDGGRTWGEKTVAGPDGEGGALAVDPVDGTLYIPMADTVGLLPAGAAPALHIDVSTDGGRNWTQHDVGPLVQPFPVEPNPYVSDFPGVTVDANGTVYFAYSAPALAPGGQAPPEEASLFGVFLRVSHDHGATWSAPLQVSTPLKDARFPWIAAGAPGRVAIVWYENVAGLPAEHLPDAWNVRLWESVTADGPQPESVTVTMNQLPAHIGGLCTSGTGCIAGGDRSLGDFFEVAIGPSGQPIVAWASSILGTAGGLVQVVGADIYFGTVDGTPLA